MIKMEEISYYLYSKFINVGYAVLRKIMGHRKFSRKKYKGKKIKNSLFTNERIKFGLDSDDAFLVARFGDAELRTVIYAIEIKFGLRKKFPEYIKKAMRLNAGFFPTNDEKLMEFAELMLESFKKVDILGVWFNLLEDYVVRKYNPSCELVQLESLEPYFSNIPWSASLEGKKVLVIHPFSETIEKQYKKRSVLFKDKRVLPSFELITYKAAQTNAGGDTNYNTWFEELDKMYEDISCIEFDVAILGCGAYGLPLAAKIKELGKKAIHLGGATQILFGIRGKRWDDRAEMMQFFNDNWTRPSENEKPILANKVEGGCYW